MGVDVPVADGVGISEEKMVPEEGETRYFEMSL